MQIPDKIPDNQLPLLPVDRHIDALGAESNIYSPADAGRYIDAILARYKVDAASVPGLAALQHRLATAEYAAISDPSKHIPEARIADAFNQLMDAWDTAQWTRITVADFHSFHRFKAGTLIPYSVSRNADGNVADSCRPVEAVYLLYLLTTERGMQSGGELGKLPPSFGRGPVLAKSAQVTAGPPAGAKVMRRDEEYRNIFNAWLQSHFKLDPAQEIGNLLDTLHIGS